VDRRRSEITESRIVQVAREGEPLTWSNSRSETRKSSGSLLSKGLHRVVSDEAMPVKLLPNVRTVWVIVKAYDWIFSLFGIRRRHAAQLRLMKNSNAIERANRYVVYQFLRMKRAYSSGNYGLAWCIGESLVRRSEVYLLQSFNFKEPNWYRIQGMSLVYRQLRTVDRLRKKMSASLDFSRVYIAKANGKLRPLGVPRRHWAIYLHMWQNVIV